VNFAKIEPDTRRYPGTRFNTRRVPGSENTRKSEHYLRKHCNLLHPRSVAFQ